MARERNGCKGWNNRSDLILKVQQSRRWRQLMLSLWDPVERGHICCGGRDAGGQRRGSGCFLGWPELACMGAERTPYTSDSYNILFHRQGDCNPSTYLMPLLGTYCIPNPVLGLRVLPGLIGGRLAPAQHVGPAPWVVSVCDGCRCMCWPPLFSREQSKVPDPLVLVFWLETVSTHSQAKQGMVMVLWRKPNQSPGTAVRNLPEISELKGGRTWAWRIGRETPWFLYPHGRWERDRGSRWLRTFVCSVCLVAQLCLTLCHPMDCSPPGFSVQEILQARILEWVAISSSGVSSWPRNRTHVSCVSCTAGRFFTRWVIREAY